MTRCACLLVLVLSVSSSGCIALAVGGAAGGGVAYILGDVERVYPYPIDMVWEATIAAMDELELSPGHQAKDQLKGNVLRYSATRDRIRVKLASQGSTTKLKLRVNTFGNEVMSTAVLAKIEEHLPMMHAAAVDGQQPEFAKAAAPKAVSQNRTKQGPTMSPPRFAGQKPKWQETRR